MKHRISLALGAGLAAACVTVWLFPLRSHSLGLKPEAAEWSIAPGPVDVGFSQNMSAHHDQAVLMSSIILQRGQSGIAGVARAIEAAQLAEAGQMRGWLALWNQPSFPAAGGANWMLLGRGPASPELSRYVAACGERGSMPGMASTEELNRLRALDGAARDRLFLQLMIRHHQGALPMARVAAVAAEHSAVRALAGRIAWDQQAEISRLAALLRELDGNTG